MTMLLQRLRFVFILAGLAIVLLLQYSGTQDIRQRARSMFADTMQLTDLTRLEQEMLRFVVTAHRYVDGAPGITQRDVGVTFDILWSRIDTLFNRIKNTSIKSIEKNEPELRRLQATLASIDNDVRALRQHDEAGMAVIDSTLQEFAPRITEMNMDAYEELTVNATEGVRTEQRSAEFLTRLQWLVVAMIGFGAAFFWLDLRNIRVLNVELEKREKEIRKLAMTDGLTGLHNRRHFDERLAEVDGGGGLANCHLLLLDIDGFKQINDSYGHIAGDHLLREIARRLRAIAGEGEFIARLGGDEFAILTQGAAERSIELANAVLTAIDDPVPFNEIQLKVSASIGISQRRTCSSPAKTLMREADLALYQAKSEGKNRLSCYSGSLAAQLRSVLPSTVVAERPAA